MAGRFQFSTPSRRGSNDPWFRVGDIDVGSAPLYAVLAAVSLLVYAIEGPSHPIITRLILYPSLVKHGDLWRVATWPLANSPDIWTAISIALLWLFGSRLEELTGRTKMLWYLLAITILPGIVGTLLDLPQGGIRAIEFVVLLTYIAEYPFARFFFGIPAWALGAVFVGLEFLSLVADRDGRSILFYLVTFGVAAIAARTIGLLDSLHFIPALPLPSKPGRRNHRPRRAAKPGSPRRPGGRGSVVEGPWSAPQPPSASPADAAAAQRELDELLDKISASGLESLTNDEKRRLNELSKRLR